MAAEIRTIREALAVLGDLDGDQLAWAGYCPPPSPAALIAAGHPDWRQAAWAFDSIGDDFDAWADIPGEWIPRREIILALLAACMIVLLIALGAAWGRAATHPDTRFVHVDPPAHVSVTP